MSRSESFLMVESSLASENAIHTLDLNHNLISIGRLDKAGCCSVFPGRGMTCLNQEVKLFPYGIAAGSEGTMHKVEVHPLTGLIYQKQQNKSLPSATATREAHARVLVFVTHSHIKPADIDT